ncbi:MAG TPA: macro domain-containing protein [Ktedonobacterales bacterium]|jgi:O-acetyl-ADP-ribose deacetylase (regulator of RNase III)|nr:macro domain-containing protein [Ktedonobacterales bacterium]
MAISYISGDLFINVYHVQAFAHGCNCAGSMGAGIAVGFRTRYPAMYEEYRRRCKATPREFNPGDVFLWKVAHQPWVFNLATQENNWRSRATYEAVEQALAAMRTLADAENVRSIAMPRIGVGYGGLSWRRVREIVERVFSDWDGTLYVYEEYVPGTVDAPIS